MKLKTLLMLFLAVSMVSAEDVSYFNNQFIPVEGVETQGDMVIASYNMDLMLGPEEFTQDISYIFGKLASDYPGSSELKVVCYGAGEPLYDYSVRTEDIRSYAEGGLTDKELLVKISYGPHQDDVQGTEGDDAGNGMFYVLLGAGMMAVILAVAAVVFGGLYAVFFRKK